MNEVVKRLLNVFSSLVEELRETGWFVDDPKSSRWWGGAESPDEVFITAILVQQTRWEVVGEVLGRLRALGLNRLDRIAEVKPEELAELIKGVNYRFTKAVRLVKLARNITSIGGLEALRGRDDVREFLLSQDGVGEETADSIMLFALNIPSLPISQYTRRVLSRVLGINFSGSYGEWKRFLEGLLPKDLYTYKLIHASVVTIGKKYCLPDKPLCEKCTLASNCNYARQLVST
ncbi:MAG: endonuclease III domain-containing protein [Vulcanisaeta sp. AZ3]|jgi:endonuclease-3 related protein|nr:MAG: DNA repair protein [Vulcanisaeta sp. AZ3]